MKQLQEIDALGQNKELQIGIEAVLEAGKTILNQIENHKANKYGLEFKAEVDKLADEAGINVLRNHFPQDAILTEEHGLPKESKGRLWVCDFLDGTTNFLNGSRNYSVLLAFVENDQIKNGICYLPATDELFYAVSGEGAYCNNKRINVSAVDELKRASIILDPGYNLKGGIKVTNLYQKLRLNVGNVGVFNANGYTLAMLAKGETAGFVHFSSKIWECSSLLIAQEAGAMITDFKGDELKLNFMSDSGFEFVATNKPIHHELLTYL